jgi:predicted small lipoprotein YifL
MAADRVRTLVAVAATAAFIACLGGCGQKGPLYLPDKGGDVVTRPAPQQAPRQPSQETAPQPSTQSPQNRSEDDGDTQPPR